MLSPSFRSTPPLCSRALWEGEGKNGGEKSFCGGLFVENGEFSGISSRVFDRSLPNARDRLGTSLKMCRFACEDKRVFPFPAPPRGLALWRNAQNIASISAMLSTVHTVAINGLTASRVLIEINVTRFDQPRDAVFVMVGLPDSAVKESKTRVRSALENSGFALPGGMDMAINFAPADVKKEGSSYDLPLAIGLLLSHERIHPVGPPIEGCIFLGELGLNGDLRPVRGVLPAAILARRMGYTTLFVPEENAREAAVVDRVQVFGVRHLTELIGHLEDRAPLLPTVVDTRAEFYAAQETFPYDFSEVKGQPLVKRAFEVAAAGGHNILLVGSPGCGKSMMAKRLPSILPPLSLAESLETTQIHSVAGKLGRGDTLISTRPFRSPHHTISDVALIGGGAHLR